MKKKRKKDNQIGYTLAKSIVQVETPAPPPPAGFSSPFKAISEWLFHLCDTSHPEKIISEYHFSLIERPSNNLLSLEGFNTYKIDENVVAHRIDFKPATHMYFALPENEFGNLSQQQVQERVLNELLEFTMSAKFQNSFLSKGNSIRMSFVGEIWSS